MGSLKLNVTKFGAMFAAALFVIIAIVSASEATPGSRPIAYVPDGSGLMQVTGGVEQPLTLVTPALLAPDSGILVGPLGGDVVGSPNSASVIKVQGRAWFSTAPSDAGIVYYQGGQYQTTGTPTAFGQILTNTDAGPAWSAPVSGGFTAGGDLTGSTTSQQVQSLTGSNSAGLVNWTSSATAPTLSEPTTSAATAAAMHIGPQQSSNTNASPGSLYTDFGTMAGTGTSAGMYMTYGGTSQVAFGQLYPSISTIYGMWFGLNGAAPSGANFTLVKNVGGTTSINDATGVDLRAGGNVYLNVTGGTLLASVPIVGNGTGATYNVHGYISTDVSGLTTYTVPASAYAMHFLDFKSATALTAPLAITLPAGNGASWTVCNLTTGNQTLTFTASAQVTATFTPVNVAAQTCQRVWSDGTNIRADFGGGTVSLTGIASVAVTSTTTPLMVTAAQANARFLKVTNNGALQYVVYPAVPGSEKWILCSASATSSCNVFCGSTSGTGGTIAVGKSANFLCDGANLTRLSPDT